MSHIFKQNTVNAIVFKLQLILLIMEGNEKSESSFHLAIGIYSQVTHHILAMKKVVKLHVLTKCSKCNTFQF